MTRDEFMIAKEESSLEGFSRHKDYHNYIYKMNYDSSAPLEQLEYRVEKAPKATILLGYRLTFGLNNKLDITENVKVVQAFLHNEGKRVTIIYKGLGSYTFVLRDAKALVEASNWKCRYKDRNFHINLEF